MAREHGHSPFLTASNVLIWASAVIVMGICSFWLHQNNNQGAHIIYEEVIAVLTVAFFLLVFLLGAFRGSILLFNLIFSYLWLVSVVFTAEDWSRNRGGPLEHCVEAFSFIAFFFLFFNAVYDWNFGYRAGRTTSSV